MPRLATRQRVGEHLARLVLATGRKLLDRFDLALQLETEIVHAAAENERCLSTLGVVRHRRLIARCVPANDVHRQLRPFDSRARIPELVGEVAELAGDGAPASAHARLADARFLAPRGLLVDHQIERHVFRQQLSELATRSLVRHRHLGGNRHVQPAIHARHAERRILNRLHEYAAPLGPLGHRLLLEEVARQTVHRADEPGALVRFRVQIIRRQVIAARENQSLEIALLARHAMQRFHAAHHGEIRHHHIVGVHEQLRPLAFHRHRFHRSAIPREATLLDDAASLEELHRATIRGLIERHRQLELIGGDAEVRAGDGNTLRVAGQLKFGRRRLERREVDVAIAEDEDATTRNAAMHPARHLENLVRAEVQLGEDVLAPLDD